MHFRFSDSPSFFKQKFVLVSLSVNRLFHFSKKKKSVLDKEHRWNTFNEVLVFFFFGSCGTQFEICLKKTVNWKTKANRDNEIEYTKKNREKKRARLKKYEGCCIKWLATVIITLMVFCNSTHTNTHTHKPIYETDECAPTINISFSTAFFFVLFSRFVEIKKKTKNLDDMNAICLNTIKKRTVRFGIALNTNDN